MGDDIREDLKTALTEIVQNQIVVLGPQVALMKARKIEGVEVDDSGKVINIKGDPKEVAQKVINEYVAFAGLVSKKVIEPLLVKYPDLSISAAL